MVTVANPGDPTADPSKAWPEDRRAVEVGGDYVDVVECIDAHRLRPRTGRSRGFVNGHTATVNQLREAGEWLVDIHGPHEHQSLLHPAKQLATLDAFGRLEKLCPHIHLPVQSGSNRILAKRGYPATTTLTSLPATTTTFLISLSATCAATDSSASAITSSGRKKRVCGREAMKP